MDAGALSLLDEYGDVRISEFARIDRCSQPSETALLQKLTDRGLVSRHTDPDDSRAVIVGITDAGREWMIFGRNAIADAMAPHFADLAPEQIQRLTEGLAELRTILRSPTF